MTELTIRPLGSGMRWIFWIGCVFVLIAGFQLFILSERTVRFFAWTVNPPLTAAVMGSFYWAALVIAFLSLRQRSWANARVGVPGVTLFLILSLSATLIHLDKFHLHDPSLLTRIAAYAWLLIYILDPILVVAAFAWQLRIPGVDSARSAPLPTTYRAVLLLLGVLFVGTGLVLFVAPAQMASSWGWTLTPLTARTIGAWIAATGVLLAQASWEDDWQRIRPGVWGALTIGALELLAIARYSDQLKWDRAAAWLWLAAVVAVFLSGAYGAYAGSDARRRYPGSGGATGSARPSLGGST